MKLHTIICSTRPGRVGPFIGQWFSDFANEQKQFSSTLVDLADFNLPIFDEPKHPAQRDYQHEHTKKWSQSVDSADAFVFVTPEYNFGPPPALVNALNYVYHEWNYKPCGFVSYGGVSGGLRSVQQTKQWVTTLKMMPMAESVMIQMPWKLLDENKRFAASDHHQSSGQGMLQELAKWSGALATLRKND